MPKRVPTIGVTVIRDGKRVTPEPGKAFDFTKEEIASVTAQHPSAFRKPVNESTEQPVDDETTPGQEGDKTAADDPKVPAKKKAAQKSSTSKAATGEQKASTGSGEPASTDAADEADADETAGEDDDI